MPPKKLIAKSLPRAASITFFIHNLPCSQICFHHRCLWRLMSSPPSAAPPPHNHHTKFSRKADYWVNIGGPIIRGRWVKAVSASAAIVALQKQGNCNGGISGLCCWMHCRRVNKGWYRWCSLHWEIATTAPGTSDLVHQSTYSCTLGRLAHSTEISWALRDQRKMSFLT
jgi:hypothetical protein